MYVVIEHHPESLECVQNNGNTIKMLGTGRMKTPGHPAGNQQYSSQAPFLRAASKGLFPVYWRVDSLVTYMGEYTVDSFQKKQSFEGFTYFVFTLFRKRCCEDPRPIALSPSVTLSRVYQ
jgi:hypothetical protein